MNVRRWSEVQWSMLLKMKEKGSGKKREKSVQGRRIVHVRCCSTPHLLSPSDRLLAHLSLMALEGCGRTDRTEDDRRHGLDDRAQEASERCWFPFRWVLIRR